jgi:stage V sporulation protein SpoVS
VGKNSNPGAIAGAIKGMLLERKRISLLAVGPDAVHHCIGAISLARIWLQAENSIDVSFRPEFFEVSLSILKLELLFSVFLIDVLFAFVSVGARAQRPNQQGFCCAYQHFER